MRKCVGDENRKVQLCLLFSVCQVGLGLVTLSLTLYYVVRPQVHGAWYFHPAQCTVTGTNSTMVQRCETASRTCTNTSVCSEWLGAVQCITVQVVHSPGSQLSTTDGTSATYYADIAALWDNPQCSFTSPACDASPQEVEQFHSLMSKWRKSQETGEVFDCYGGNEKNKHEVLGRLLYTSTIAYLVILIPVLMMCVGLGILGWSCCELLCCSPKARAERYREKQKEKRKTGSNNKYVLVGTVASPLGGAARGRIGACNNRMNKPSTSAETDTNINVQTPMLEETET